MVNTVIIYNSKSNKNSHYIAEHIRKLICNKCSVSMIDMAPCKPLHEYFFEIKNHHAKLHITIELAGFELKTEADKPSYNIISGRFFHIITKEETSYSELSDIKNNLSHFICRYSENELLFSSRIEELMKEAELQ